MLIRMKYKYIRINTRFTNIESLVFQQSDLIKKIAESIVLLLYYSYFCKEFFLESQYER